jgi:hypothetical protein
MLMVYQEPMVLQWAKVVTVIPVTINSQDNSDEDYRPEPKDEEEGYDTASAQQDQMGGAQHRGRAPRTSTKWPSVTSWNFSRSVSNAKMWISKFRFEIECMIKI